ncbi:MAG TPA: DUF2071 domain-containing protein, partial [Niastella sp.]|nr:DUF2071 domain-containing protein [Niastella sp.]
MPKGRWRYYQEWNHTLFLHWSLPVNVLRSAVPKNLDIDLFDGQAWVSVVAFTMQKIRPRNLPAVS